MRTCMPHIRTCMYAYACVRACTHALHLCWVASLIEQKLHALRCGVSAHCRCRYLFLCLSLSLSLFLSHHAAWPFQQPSPLSQSAERPCRRCFATLLLLKSGTNEGKRERKRERERERKRDARVCRTIKRRAARVLLPLLRCVCARIVRR